MGGEPAPPNTNKFSVIEPKKSPLLARWSSQYPLTGNKPMIGYTTCHNLGWKGLGFTALFIYLP